MCCLLSLDILDLLCTQVLNSSAAIIYLTDTERWVYTADQKLKWKLPIVKDTYMLNIYENSFFPHVP